MNEPDDVPGDDALESGGQEPGGRGRELVPDAWRELDDTLADGPAPAEVPVAAREWLADQRFMHGMLRALHTQDAAAREGRIAAILARIDHIAIEPRRRWLPVAVAALLLACLGIWFVLPQSLPTADAAVQRAVAELARDVTRRFRITGAPTAGTTGPRNELSVLTRPGGRFRAEGRLSMHGQQLGQLRIGSDGVELWVSALAGAIHWSVPIGEREGLQQRFGDALELGYVDVHDLVRKMSNDFELKITGREQLEGRSVLRIEATRSQHDAPVRAASLLVDEASGMVTRIETDLVRGGMGRHVTFEYVGEEPGTVEFQRPW